MWCRCQPREPKEAEFRLRDLVEDRVASNDVVYFAVEPTEFSQNLMDCAMEGSEEGYMKVPRKVADLDLSDAQVSRMIAVREWRWENDQWTEKTRAVDHKTESDPGERQAVASDAGLIHTNIIDVHHGSYRVFDVEQTST